MFIKLDFRVGTVTIGVWNLRTRGRWPNPTRKAGKWEGGGLMMGWLTNHRLFLLLLLATVLSVCWLSRANGRLRLTRLQTVLLGIAHTCIGVLAVKAFAIIEGFGDLSVVGNMSLFGGMAFMPIFYAGISRWGKRSARDVFDVFTISLVMTLFFARINCLFAGCCLGAFVPGTSLRWPTRELELVYYAVFLALLMPRVLHGELRGQVFPLYMVSYGCFRFVIEFFRASSHALGPFHIAHVWALIAIVLGASILVETRQQKAKER